MPVRPVVWEGPQTQSRSPDPISRPETAPTYSTAYDAQAEVNLVRTNGNGALPSGYERTMAIDRYFTKIGIAWHYATTNYVFLTDGSDDNRTMSRIVLEHAKPQCHI